MLDVRKSRELQATILSLKGAERTVRLGINKDARSTITPLWRAEVNARARTSLQREIIARGVRATASDRGMTFYAATSGRPLSGGLIPSDRWQGAEFGARDERVTVRQRSRAGRPYTRPLWINRQYQDRNPHGRVGMAAASVAGTRLVALWVTNVVGAFKAIPAVEVTPV